MLNAMRRGAGSIFSKLLLILLILSFSVWGIEDMLRTGGARAKLATVGGHEISRTAFETAYRREMDRARQILGRNYTPELARMLGLERKVLDDLIANELLRLETHALGLTPPDDDVAREIRAMANFKNEKGGFDKAYFQTFLRQNGLSEKAYVEDIRRQLALRLLLQTVVLTPPVNGAMATVLYAAAQEERTADIAILSPALVKNVPAPTHPDIETYYNEHKEAFATPEYRTVSYVTVRTDELLKNVTVPEEEIKAAYDERASLFGGAAEPYEKVRASLEKDVRLHKLDEAVSAFSTRLDDALAGGDSMKEVAAAMRMEHATLGPIGRTGNTPDGAKARLPDFANFLDTAFRLDEGAESALMPAKDGLYYLLRVESIKPEAPQPLADIHGKVEAAWKQEETQKRLATLAQQIAREMQSAKDPLAAAAQQGARISSSGIVKRNEPKTSSGLALPTVLTQDIFATPVGAATGVYPGQDGNFFIAVVKSRKAPPVLSAEALKKNAAFQQSRRQLEQRTQEDLLDAYLGYLYGKYEVHINAEALNAYASEQP